MKRIIKSVKTQIVKLGQQLYPYKDIIQWVDKNSKSSKDTKFYTLVHKNTEEKYKIYTLVHKNTEDKYKIYELEA